MADIDIGVVQGDTNYILRVGADVARAAGAVCRILAAISHLRLQWASQDPAPLSSHVTEFIMKSTR